MCLFSFALLVALLEAPLSSDKHASEYNEDVTMMLVCVS